MGGEPSREALPSSLSQHRQLGDGASIPCWLWGYNQAGFFPQNLSLGNLTGKAILHTSVEFTFPTRPRCLCSLSLKLLMLWQHAANLLLVTQASSDMMSPASARETLGE